MFRRNSKLLTYGTIFALSFLFLFVSANFFIPLKFSVVEHTSPFMRILLAPILEVKKIFLYHRTFEEYMRLRSEVSALKAKLVGMDEIMRENNRISQLLNFKRKLGFSTVAANVSWRDPSNWNAAVIIDKGRKNGLAVGMPVVSPQGIVGKVAEVSERSAKVILLSDSSFSVPALIKRSREVGLVSGTLQEGICRMRYLSDGADVEVGDQVITSKFSTSFPEGLLVGEIKEVYVSGNSPTKECLVQPSALLSQIEEVLVITSR